MSDDQSARHTTIDEVDDELEQDSSANETRLRQSIRQLAADLVHDILAAVASASAAELGELIRYADDHGNHDDAPRLGVDRVASRSAGVASGTNHTRAADSAIATVPRERSLQFGAPMPDPLWKRRGLSGGIDGSVQVPDRQPGIDARAQLAPNDPFDITSPHELLASTDEPPQQPVASSDSTEVPQEQARSASLPSLLQQPATESTTALMEGDSDAASERRPKVVLRAGERLLSATGSGVVIGRERRER
jgi:hypothetical protein